MRLIHTADWQIGARFRRFGDRAPWLRQVRIDTLRRTLELAVQRQVDAFIVAGDLFEDHGLDAVVLKEVWDAFAEAASVRVFIVPGNHDPASGPAAIWNRKPFSALPANVRVFTQPEAVPLSEDAWLIASPLCQKRSTVDPSLELDALAASLPASAIKIGVTHGCPAVEGLYEADDFPIARDAATRGGLDYLAIGHWHGFQVFDGGRMVMPGTPEQTDFSETNAGNVVEVEIDGRGSQPRLTQVRTGLLHWKRWECDLTDTERAQIAVEQLARELVTPAEAVVRAVLSGSVSAQAAAELSDLLKSRLGACAILEVLDETTTEITPEEASALQADHPMLGAVLMDLDRLAGGTSPGELAGLCGALNCSPEQITPEMIARARQILFAELRSLKTPC